MEARGSEDAQGTLRIYLLLGEIHCRVAFSHFFNPTETRLATEFGSLSWIWEEFVLSSAWRVVYFTPVYNMVISGFHAARQARAPVTGLEPATEVVPADVRADLLSTMPPTPQMMKFIGHYDRHAFTARSFNR
ncbi:hypothetical protein PoB_007535200 [Plakobranchus ocellatus]|uniref:Uncharacterized protein n=1 Tax=Plakobranchus ocellatus TaxID=259542 RepID=A0AAV4DXU2_9GAST|nr:hypothetical protein PoB_007535200 [Plakobranchus ocellatus]